MLSDISLVVYFIQIMLPVNSYFVCCTAFAHSSHIPGSVCWMSSSVPWWVTWPLFITKIWNENHHFRQFTTKCIPFILVYVAKLPLQYYPVCLGLLALYKEMKNVHADNHQKRQVISHDHDLMERDLIRVIIQGVSHEITYLVCVRHVL